MQFILANLFLLLIALIGAGSLFLVGFTMWHFGLPPDDNPARLMFGCAVSLLLTYYVSKWLHSKVQKRT